MQAVFLTAWPIALGAWRTIRAGVANPGPRFHRLGIAPAQVTQRGLGVRHTFKCGSSSCYQSAFELTASQLHDGIRIGGARDRRDRTQECD